MDDRKPAYSEVQVEIFLSELTTADRMEVTTPLHIFAEDVKGQVRNFQEARHIAGFRDKHVRNKVDKEKEYTNDPINMICMTIYKELSVELRKRQHDQKDTITWAKKWIDFLHQLMYQADFATKRKFMKMLIGVRRVVSYFVIPRVETEINKNTAKQHFDAFETYGSLVLSNTVAILFNSLRRTAVRDFAATRIFTSHGDDTIQEILKTISGKFTAGLLANEIMEDLFGRADTGRGRVQYVKDRQREWQKVFELATDKSTGNAALQLTNLNGVFGNKLSRIMQMRGFRG